MGIFIKFLDGIDLFSILLSISDLAVSPKTNNFAFK